MPQCAGSKSAGTLRRWVRSASASGAASRWALHCGDAFYHRGILDRRTPVRPAWKAFEVFSALDRARVRANHDRLAELYHRADPDMLMICAHDAVMLHRAQAE